MGGSPLNPFSWASELFFVLIVLALLLRLRFLQPANRKQRLVAEVLAIGPAVLLYFLVRGFVNARFDAASANAQRIIELERRLGIYYEEQFQNLIMGSELLINIVNWIYIWGHWPLLAGVMVWLVVCRPNEFPRYRNALIVSGALGMLVFATFPVAPPRLMEDLLFVDTVTERSHSYRVLQPPSLTNPYAAMPSLHFGWNLLMGIAIVEQSRHWASKLFGVLMPLAMFLAIVLTANHYFLDGVVGGVLVLLSLAIVGAGTLFGERWWRRRPQRGIHRSQAGHAHLRELFPTRRPMFIAHRAGNDLASLRTAEELGVDIIEADVWLYRGRLEVRHTKTAGPLPVLWDRWSLQRASNERMQLATLLSEAGPESVLMLDLKGRDPAVSRLVLAELQRHHAGRPILVCSQNWSLLRAFTDIPAVTVVYSIGNQWQLRRSWDHLASDECQVLSIQFQLLNAEMASLLKERVPVVFTWAINSHERLETVVDWHLDGVITDNLGLIPDKPSTTEAIPATLERKR